MTRNSLPEPVFLEFISEIKEDLVRLESDLLRMEGGQGQAVDGELVNTAFRAIHSIKGGAGFIQLTWLCDLAHTMENVLMLLREGRLSPNPAVTDALLGGLDRMKGMVDDGSGLEEADIQPQVAALEAVLDTPPEGAICAGKTGAARDETSPSREGDNGVAPLVPETWLKTDPGETLLQLGEPGEHFAQKTFPVGASALEKALARRWFIYAVRIPAREVSQAVPDPGPEDSHAYFKDIQCAGDLLFPQTPDTGLLWQRDFYLVLATLLDRSLLAGILGVSEEEICFVSRQFLPLEGIPGIRSGTGLWDMPYGQGDMADGDMANGTAGTAPPVEGADPRTNGVVSFDSQTVRVKSAHLSRLMNRAGELVLSRNQLRPLMEEILSEYPEAGPLMQNLDMVTSDIQETIMQLRMQPVSHLFEKYRRVVRDLARRLEKQVNYTIQGGQVEVDRNILELLAGPLTHLIRNAVDHGIEPPEERERMGKSPRGNMGVTIHHQSGHVRMEIWDDGRGMDADLILEKARKKGLISMERSRGLSRKEKLNLVMLPGFSTLDQVSEFSGRGVGMDVVKTNLERLRGHIEMESHPGEGTCIALTIPLTLAIVPSLIVGEGHTRFAIPQINVKEVVHLTGPDLPRQVTNIAGQDVLQLRDDLYPVVRLRNVLEIKTHYRDPRTGVLKEDRRRRIADRRSLALEEGVGQLSHTVVAKPNQGFESRKIERRKRHQPPAYAVILKLGSQRFGLLVEDLFDIEEVVVEPLSDFIKGLRWFAGAAILGDGEVIMVLDVNGLAAGACLAFDTIRNEVERQTSDPGEDAPPERLMDLLVFEHQDGEFFALPLGDVARLEPISREGVHTSGGVDFIRFKDQACRLVDLGMFLPVPPMAAASSCHGIFLKHSHPSAAVRARSIVDTVQWEEGVLTDDTDPRLVRGKVFTQGMMIQLLDPRILKQQIRDRFPADPAWGEAPEMDQKAGAWT